MQSKIKLSMKIDPTPLADEMLFARQLGLEYAYTWVDEAHMDDDSLTELRQAVNDAGINLWMVGNFNVGKSDQIHLNLPGRDERIAQYQDFIRALGRAGIRHTTFTWEPTQVWSSPRGENRLASARYVNLAEMRQRPMTHEREYTLDELWENFEYFINAMLPVCEEADVRVVPAPQ